MERCEWVPLSDELYTKYHDEEWGVPIHDDKKIFEMLILESAQAGLSWITILRKREFYKKAFDNFDYFKISKYDSDKINELMLNKNIIRNKNKINSAIKNANVFIKIIEEFGSFDNYIWKFVNYEPIINNFKSISEVPAYNNLSKIISDDLKKYGMNFVGPTIIYSFMQAIGLVNDHIISCFKRNK